MMTFLQPVGVWGQSEVTRQVSIVEMGYRGRVHRVQSTEFCMDSVNKFFRTTTEEYNEQGLRTDMSEADFLYQTNYHYEYDDNGQLVYYVAAYSDGGRDSIAFHYDKNGCLFGYEEYGFNADPEEGNGVTDFMVTCDARCRVLMCASVWEDTARYEYDQQGRIVAVTWPGSPQTFHYDQQGRLARVRTGTEFYEDTHYRYNEQGDTVEVWQTNWERYEKEKGNHEVGEHKYFTYTEYDDHGNWKKADVKVKENGIPFIYHIVRTFSYYE